MSDRDCNGSRPFEVFGEEEIRYTPNHGNVYATVLNWHKGELKLRALRSGGATLGKVIKVELLGVNVSLPFVQDDQSLTVTAKEGLLPLPGISNPVLSSSFRAANRP